MTNTTSLKSLREFKNLAGGGARREDAKLKINTKQLMDWKTQFNYISSCNKCQLIAMFKPENLRMCV